MSRYDEISKDGLADMLDDKNAEIERLTCQANTMEEKFLEWQGIAMKEQTENSRLLTEYAVMREAAEKVFHWHMMTEGGMVPGDVNVWRELEAALYPASDTQKRSDALEKLAELDVPFIGATDGHTNNRPQPDCTAPKGDAEHCGPGNCWCDKAAMGIGPAPVTDNQEPPCDTCRDQVLPRVIIDSGARMYCRDCYREITADDRQQYPCVRCREAYAGIGKPYCPECLKNIFADERQP